MALPACNVRVKTGEWKACARVIKPGHGFPGRLRVTRRTVRPKPSAVGVGVTRKTRSPETQKGPVEVREQNCASLGRRNAVGVMTLAAWE